MNQSIPSQLTSQVLNNQIVSDYIGFIRDRLYESDICVLKFLLTKYQIHKKLQYSYDYISLATGVPYGTVRRAIERLESFGIIQKWALGGPNFYLLNEFFKQASVLSRIKRFFIGFMFFGFLSSSGGGEQVLILKESILLKQPAAALQKADALSCWQVMEMNMKFSVGTPRYGGSWQYQEKEKVTANKTKSLKGDERMLNFNAEQMDQLQAFSQEAIDRATQRLAQVNKQGNPPADPFKWVMAICRNYAPGEGQQPKFTVQALFLKNQISRKNSQWRPRNGSRQMKRSGPYCLNEKSALKLQQ